MLKGKINKHKLKRRCDGVISIFMCIIITPLLTLASSLVEYSRYQNAMSIATETINVSTNAALSDYDRYLNDRFGLMALNQNTDVNSKYTEYLNYNSGLFGESQSLSVTSAEGIMPLSDTEVMKQQLVDYGEISSMLDTLLEEGGLDELISKLDNSAGALSLLDKTNNLSALADSVSNLVDDAQEFSEEITKISSTVVNVKDKIENINNKIHSLYEDISIDIKEIQKDENGKIVNIIFKIDDDKLLEKYKERIDKIASDCIYVRDNVDTIKDSLAELKKKYTTIVDVDLPNVKKSLEDFKGNKSDNNKLEESDDDVAGIFDTVIKEMDQAFKEAKSTFEDKTISSFQEALSNVKKDIINSLGIDNTIKQAKDLKDKTIIQLLKDISTGELEKKVKELKDSVVNNLLNLYNLSSIVKSAIDKACKGFTDSVKDSLTALLESLVSTINGIFQLDIFYDPDLCAYLDPTLTKNNSTEDNPYIELLEALGTFLDGVNDLKNSVSGTGGIIEKFKSAISGLKKVLKSGGKVIKALGKSFEQLKNKIDDFSSIDGIDDLYKQFACMSNIAHSLPCRTNFDDSEYCSLSGYNFTDINYLVKTKSTELEMTKGITSLVSFLKTAKDGSGNDKNFCGAELEYVLVGTDSEIFNQMMAFMDIYILRIALDIMPIFMNTEVQAMAGAANVFGWVVYLLEVFAEPLVDTVLLVNGAEVPVIKHLKNGVYLTPTGISKLITKISEISTSNKKVGKAMNNYAENLEKKMKNSKYSSGAAFKEGYFNWKYNNYLMLFCLLLNPVDTTVDRFIVVAKIEARNYYGTDFKMEKAYTAIKSTNKIELKSILPVMSLDGYKVNITKQRGY